MTDVEDTVRKFPHISAEFLAWQKDPHRRQWPSEMSVEYREAKEIKDRAPSFTTLGRMHDLGARAAVVYVLLLLGAVLWDRYL